MTSHFKTASRAIRLVLMAGAALAALPLAAQPQAATRLPAPPAETAPASPGLQTAILSGGCFWGVQGVFEHVKGVRLVYAGYAGGKRETAHYEMVGTETTGHAESVQVVFDPKIISYGEILRIFFSVATDPTQVNRQFPDQGPSYRSEIWYLNAGQKAQAERYIAQLNAAKAFSRPIATRVDPSPGFFRAEGYHQDYLVHHPDQPYIATYDLPKVAALKALFPTEYRATPVTTS